MILMTQVWQLPNYVKAAQASHLRSNKTLMHDCMNAELEDIIGDTVYFRNYEDSEVDFIEFCFTREGVGKIKFNYVSYVDWDGREEE